MCGSDGGFGCRGSCGGFGCRGSSGGYMGQVVMDLVVGFYIFAVRGGRGFPWWWWWLMWVCGAMVVVGNGHGGG